MKRLFLVFVLYWFTGCSSNRNLSESVTKIDLHPTEIHTGLQLTFKKGTNYNHPSFAVWIEDMEGRYIETLFTTQYVGKSYYKFSNSSPGKWKNEPGFERRPATLPYWAHKRNIKSPDGLYVPSKETPVPDAVSGATPKGNFTIYTGTTLQKNQKFRVLFEINQPWDSNEFWTNNKFPGDYDYFSSLQPSLIYAVTIDPNSSERELTLNPIGHGHPSGKTGELFTDLSTLTTAKNITAKISIQVK